LSEDSGGNLEGPRNRPPLPQNKSMISKFVHELNDRLKVEGNDTQAD
jgi:hypothetical protein